jgi:uncharacterized protein YacL
MKKVKGSVSEKFVTKEVPPVVAEKAGILEPTAAFTRELAREIVKNLTAFGKLTTYPFRKAVPEEPITDQTVPTGDRPILVDTSVLIDSRIVPVVQSGFFVGTLVIPQFILGELQHIADSDDAIRRAKGRRGLEVVTTLQRQKVNDRVTVKVVGAIGVGGTTDADGKLVRLAKLWSIPLMTVDFNLAQVARANGIKVFNLGDLSQALKVALIPGESVTVKITHLGKERAQGVGYLSDGTMVVVEDAKEKVGSDVSVSITKVHQTPAGQLFFGKIK